MAGAGLTHAVDLNRAALGGKSRKRNFLAHDLYHARGGALFDLLTTFADEQHQFVLMLVFHVATPHIGIQRFNPVDESMFLKKLECPVDRHGGRPLIKAFNAIKKVVSLGRLMAFPDQLEHLAANRREACAFFRAAFLGLCQRGLNAVLVVVGVHQGVVPCN